MRDQGAAGAGPLWALGDLVPVLAPDAWVAPTALVIGDVEIGAQSSVWYHCVLRGDINRIRIGARSNVQDGTVIHVGKPEDEACIIGDDVTVGHSALLHACTVHDGGFVGMAATVLNRAVIEEGGMLAAGGLLTPGKRIGRYELWAGSPAKLVRVMSPSERDEFADIARRYVGVAAHHKAEARPL
ncbi:MAG TPA: gamma carbonic anhydrase family protein [Acetobacteraceae bacterium]|nr:gamma carbonic anhydrase family protein [Acetobacteraceae bacterium]